MKTAPFVYRHWKRWNKYALKAKWGKTCPASWRRRGYGNRYATSRTCAKPSVGKQSKRRGLADAGGVVSARRSRRIIVFEKFLFFGFALVEKLGWVAFFDELWFSLCLGCAHMGLKALAGRANNFIYTFCYVEGYERLSNWAICCWFVERVRNWNWYFNLCGDWVCGVFIVFYLIYYSFDIIYSDFPAGMFKLL